MSNALPPGIQDRRSAILGWILFLGFFILLANILLLPRTALDERQGLRLFHDSLGVVVIVLAAVKLAWMARGPRPSPPPGLPDNSFGLNRAILAALFTVFVITGLLGFVFAFGEHDRPIVLFGIPIPQLLPEGDTLRKPGGYLHSALSFYYMMLASIWVAYGVWQHLRYRVGLARLFPGSRV